VPRAWQERPRAAPRVVGEAGSGKTTALALRWLRLAETEGPGRVLVLCPTPACRSPGSSPGRRPPASDPVGTSRWVSCGGIKPPWPPGRRRRSRAHRRRRGLAERLRGGGERARWSDGLVDDALAVGGRHACHGQVARATGAVQFGAFGRRDRRCGALTGRMSRWAEGANGRGPPRDVRFGAFWQRLARPVPCSTRDAAAEARPAIRRSRQGEDLSQLAGQLNRYAP
jgi:hypothetical protein